MFGCDVSPNMSEVLKCSATDDRLHCTFNCADVTSATIEYFGLYSTKQLIF